MCSQVWLHFGSTFRTWRGPRASWSLTKSRCWWSKWGPEKGPPWAPWDHSTTCTTSWRSALTHTHTCTFRSNPFKTFIFAAPVSPSVSQLSSPHDRQQKKTKKNQSLSLLCKTTRGSQLWLVYCHQSHWGLEPRPK